MDYSVLTLKLLKEHGVLGSPQLGKLLEQHGVHKTQVRGLIGGALSSKRIEDAGTREEIRYWRITEKGLAYLEAHDNDPEAEVVEPPFKQIGPTLYTLTVEKPDEVQRAVDYVEGLAILGLPAKIKRIIVEIEVEPQE